MLSGNMSTGIILVVVGAVILSSRFFGAGSSLVIIAGALFIIFGLIQVVRGM